MGFLKETSLNAF